MKNRSSRKTPALSLTALAVAAAEVAGQAVKAGDVLLSSAPLTDGELPGETTVWLR